MLVLDRFWEVSEVDTVQQYLISTLSCTRSSALISEHGGHNAVRSGAVYFVVLILKWYLITLDAENKWTK